MDGRELALLGSCAPSPDLSDDSPDAVQRWVSRLADAWTTEVAGAIEAASSTLAIRVRDVLDGGERETRRVRGAVISVTGYLLRMRSRATPFGLFAGVASLRIGEAATVRWGGGHRAHARPVESWVAATVAALERDERVQDLLTLTVNDLCVVRGGRLVVPCQRQKDGEPVDVSVRYSRPVAAAVAHARDGLARVSGQWRPCRASQAGTR